MHGLMMDYPLTIDRILEHANRMYPRKRITTKLPDGSLHRYTYADLYARVKRLANVLRELGVGPGDRVGTFAWNSYQHLELYYAVPCSGAVCHTLNIRLSPEQLAYIINHAEDEVIFVDATLLPVFEQVVDQIETVKHYVALGLGIAAESGICLTEEDRDRLTAIEIPKEYGGTTTYGVIMRRDKYVSPALREFLSLLDAPSARSL